MRKLNTILQFLAFFQKPFMDKSTMTELKNQLKENTKILRDMTIVLNARVKFGMDNKNQVLNHLTSKYGEEKGNKLVEQYWNSIK